MFTIEDKLHIIIITYNRAPLLDATLKQLLDSPFKNCHITISNNASQDHTLDVCSLYQKQFPHFSTYSNQFNIGGDANILRAIELCSKDYCWILADDDQYNFSCCQDVIDIIISSQVDLIHVGAHTDVNWEFGGYFEDPKSLINKGYPFFRFSSFLPCNIFKKASFIPYIIAGYKNISNLYPHMPFLISFFTEGKKIYLSQHRIVKAVIGYQNYSRKDFINGWIQTSWQLKSRCDIATCLFQQFGKSHVRIFWSILWQVTRKEMPLKFATKFFLALSYYQRVIAILGMTPHLLLKSISHTKKRFKNKKHDTLIHT